MAKIPQYTQTVIRERATPRLYDYNAVSNSLQKGALFRNALGITSDVLNKYVEAEETTALNNVSIAQKKALMQYSEQAINQNIDNPSGFADRASEEIKAISKTFEEQLPTNRAKREFRQSSAKTELEMYASNFRWQNKRQVEIFAERTEEAATNIADVAYMAGKQGKSFDDIIRDVDATVVSVGTFQPNEAILRESQKRMQESASLSYIKGLSISNPGAAVRLIDSGAFSGKISVEKLDTIRRYAGKDAVKRAAKNDIGGARGMAKTGLYGDPKALLGMVDAEEKRQNVTKYTSNVTNSATLMVGAIDGEIDIVDVINSNIPEEDKKLTLGLLSGDEEALEAVRENLGEKKGFFDQNTSYALADKFKAAKQRFAASEQNDEDALQYANSINQIKNTASLAYGYKVDGRSKGLNKTEYKDILKKIAAESSSVYDTFENNNPWYSGSTTAFDHVLDGIENLSDDPATRASLLGYASAVAQQNGVDMSARPKNLSVDSLKETRRVADQIIKEVSRHRRTELGLPEDAPETEKALINGQKQRVGVASPNTKPDRAVSSPKPVTAKFVGFE
jgi:hypothetical protein